jgi:hypothetical protein
MDPQAFFEVLKAFESSLKFKPQQRALVFEKDAVKFDVKLEKIVEAFHNT